MLVLLPRNSLSTKFINDVVRQRPEIYIGERQEHFAAEAEEQPSLLRVPWLPGGPVLSAEECRWHSVELLGCLGCNPCPDTPSWGTEAWFANIQTRECGSAHLIKVLWTLSEFIVQNAQYSAWHINFLNQLMPSFAKLDYFTANKTYMYGYSSRYI